MKNQYLVTLYNKDKCAFDHSQFTNLKKAKKWACGRGITYVDIDKNYNEDTNTSEELIEYKTR